MYHTLQIPLPYNIGYSESVLIIIQQAHLAVFKTSEICSKNQPIREKWNGSSKAKEHSILRCEGLVDWDRREGCKCVSDTVWDGV